MQVSPWAAPPICAMSDSSWLKRRSSKGWWKPQGPGTSMANLKTKKSCLESFRYDWVIRISVEPGGLYIRYKPTKSRFLWFNDSIVFQPGSMDRLSHSTPAVPLERQMWAPKPETAHILSTWIVGIRTITTKEWQIPSPPKKTAAYRPYNLTNPSQTTLPASISRDTPTTQLGSRVPRPCLKPLRSVSDCRSWNTDSPDLGKITKRPLWTR